MSGMLHGAEHLAGKGAVLKRVPIPRFAKDELLVKVKRASIGS